MLIILTCRPRTVCSSLMSITQDELVRATRSPFMGPAIARSALWIWVCRQCSFMKIANASVNCSNLATSKLLIALKFPLDNSENLAFVAPISPNTTLSTETDMRCPRAPDQIFSVLTDRSGVGHPLRSDIWSSENLTPEFLVADRVLIANYQGL